MSKNCPFLSIIAPRAVSQSAVASISIFVSLQRIRVGLSAKAAQINALCATDFEDIAGMVPLGTDG